MARLTSLTRNENAFFDTIGYSEGTIHLSDDGYACVVGGGSFASYAQHPRIAVQTRWGWSSAAGRYQIMAAVPGKVNTDTWDWSSKVCRVTDFSPESQDIVCRYLINHCDALDDVNAGRFESAVVKCAKTWASFPSSPYGQRTNTMDKLKQFYISAGGQISG